MEIKKVFVSNQRNIPIGYQGENNVTHIIFCQEAELLEYNWTLFHRRAMDKEAYPVPLDVTSEGLVWKVTSGDTAYNGSGIAQLICLGTDDEILKTMTYGTVVSKSIPVTGEVPDPVKPWYDDIMQKIEQGGGSGSTIDLDTTLTSEGKAADAKAVGDALAEKQPKGDYALKDDIPTVPVASVNGKTGDVNLNAQDVGALPDTYTPPEAPVQSVNGKVGAVDLTAEDVGALPASTEIPSKTSDLVNDSGYLNSYTETDPTVPAWAKNKYKPSYTADEVGADLEGTATKQVSAHNSDEAAHSDIRVLVSGLTERLNALANSDDETLDQMAEVVAYIKDNRELIEQVTTGKVSVSDIVDNLTTNVANKPLSAAQGVALKKLIDAITVPTKVSQLTNDSGYLTQHQDISGKLDADKLPEAINDALAQAKESGEFDGKDGDSVTVASVTESTADGGINMVEFSDGKKLTVKNGSKGSPGATGDPGKDGYTPVKGTDYWTDADKAEIVAEVLAALGNPSVFGYVDENNIITITGDLADGTYTLQYENEDGTTTKIGTIIIGNVAIVNVIPISTDADGNIYNGTGYKTGTRIRSTGVEVTDVAECELTGFIPFVKGDVLRGNEYSFSGIKNDGSAAFKNTTAYNSVACFDASKTWLASVSLDMRTATADGLTVNSNSSFVFESILNANIPAATAYIRVSMLSITDNTVFTVNQEIS